LDAPPCSGVEFSAFGLILKAGLHATSIFSAGTAFGANDDDGATSASIPAVYLDLRTIYAQVPAGSLAFGFGRPTLFNALQPLATLNRAAFPTGLPAAKSLNVDFPLTVDVTDSVSLYAGVSGSSMEFGGTGWSSFQVTSWNIGFQADLYQENGEESVSIWPAAVLAHAVNSGGTGTLFGGASPATLMQPDPARKTVGALVPRGRPKLIV
jgi:hypothetical protein